MKLLTASLTGKALDWALAKALDLEPRIDYFDVQRRPSVTVEYKMTPCSLPHSEAFSHAYPSTLTSLIGFEYGKVREIIAKKHGLFDAVGFKAYGEYPTIGKGATPFEAVARCVVAMRLGGEVDVPDELCGEQA